MRISEVALTPIAFPDPPLLNSAGVHQPWALRTIVELRCGLVWRHLVSHVVVGRQRVEEPHRDIVHLVPLSHGLTGDIPPRGIVVSCWRPRTS